MDFEDILGCIFYGMLFAIGHRIIWYLFIKGLDITLKLIEYLYDFFIKFVGFILSILHSFLKNMNTRVVLILSKDLGRLLSVIVTRFKSHDAFLGEYLSRIFFNAENKEEIVGDLLEQDEYMRELGYSNSKRLKNMLIQIFVIKISLIKTKIENAFSVGKKIDNT